MMRHDYFVHSYDVSKKHPQGKTLGAALGQVFDPEVTSWLLAELAENRDKHVGPKKVTVTLTVMCVEWHHLAC